MRDPLTMNLPSKGDMKVWWIPQVPMKAFEVPVKNLEEAILLLETLAKYDMFQYENNVKGDYCNAGGLVVYECDYDGYGNPGWCDWYDLETGDSIDEVMKERRYG